ncbi:MAG: hypothetical protein R2708_05155 [Vicinamibacterales bacterium]
MLAINHFVLPSPTSTTTPSPTPTLTTATPLADAQHHDPGPLGQPGRDAPDPERESDAHADPERESVSPTPTPSATITPTPTPTVGITPTPTPTPSASPAPTPAPSPGRPACPVRLHYDYTVLRSPVRFAGHYARRRAVLDAAGAGRGSRRGVHLPRAPVVAAALDRRRAGRSHPRGRVRPGHQRALVLPAGNTATTVEPTRRPASTTLPMRARNQCRAGSPSSELLVRLGDSACSSEPSAPGLLGAVVDEAR